MTDLSVIPEGKWNEARRRADIVRPLAERNHCPRHLARSAASELGISERQIYTLLRRMREAGGTVTALLPTGPRGGLGQSRLSKLTEEMTANIIQEVYLTRQKRTAALLIREVQGRCRAANMRPPSANTIRRRIKALPLADQAKRGDEQPQTVPVTAATPAVKYPLDFVQMDHTKVDLILVDPTDRLPIGRPYLTVAIDVFSRCIVGFHLSLDAPSATSVGLCLTHAAFDKAQWLEARGIEAAWPVAGKPRRVGVDNGADFHSDAFERGCEQHGISIEWRPPGLPHFGGIIERVIGTLMELVHALPGTTFSNVPERGNYDSDKTACLTLEELERWLTVAITKYYHLRGHEGIDGEAPLRRYEKGLQLLAAAGAMVPMPRDARAFLIDFLPVCRRTLQRDGVTLDHIVYFSNALKPWIQDRNRTNPLILRRDPRDLSRIYVLDPIDNAYLEIPYRTLSRPAITLWEHRLALRRLREHHRQNIDEEALFAAVEEMRQIEHDAARLTRTARRNRTRRPIVTQETPDQPSRKVADDHPRPFEDVKEW